MRSSGASKADGGAKATNISIFWNYSAPAISRLSPPRRRILMAPMASPNRLQFTLVLVLLVALCLFVPSVLYFTELALRELRVVWWLLLLIGGLLWLLSLGRRRP